MFRLGIGCGKSEAINSSSSRVVESNLSGSPSEASIVSAVGEIGIRKAGEKMSGSVCSGCSGCSGCSAHSVSSILTGHSQIVFKRRQSLHLGRSSSHFFFLSKSALVKLTPRRVELPCFARHTPASRARCPRPTNRDRILFIARTARTARCAHMTETCKRSVQTSIDKKVFIRLHREHGELPSHRCFCID